MGDQAPPQPEGWDELRAAPRKAVSRKYKVVGPKAVYELQPGATGMLSLTPDQESHLIESGHIVRVANGPKPESKKEIQNG